MAFWVVSGWERHDGIGVGVPDMGEQSIRDVNAGSSALDGRFPRLHLPLREVSRKSCLYTYDAFHGILEAFCTESHQ